MSVVVVDTGVANLHSVTSALGRLDVDWRVSSELAIIAAADRLILPGVGSARAGMAALERKGLTELLKTYDRPMLGICLGMQLMFDQLGESDSRGLSIFPDLVSKLETGDLPLPHMGWNTLDILRDDNIVASIEPGAYVYFVHSFGVGVGTSTIASTQYGTDFSAIVRRDNRIGCQFHPERSGVVGAQILQNFLTL